MEFLEGNYRRVYKLRTRLLMAGLLDYSTSHKGLFDTWVEILFDELIVLLLRISEIRSEEMEPLGCETATGGAVSVISIRPIGL